MATFLLTMLAIAAGGVLAMLGWAARANERGGRGYAIGAAVCLLIALWGVRDMLS